jgi:hypothetical protein
MAVETDKQRHQRRIDTLEAEIATDDIADATIIGTRHAYQIFQNDFRQETTEQAQCEDTQQMDISLPLPYFESEGLEDGDCQHHEGATDEAYIDGIFMTLVHTVGKSNTILQDYQTIRHIFMLNIPYSWKFN